jgi:3-(3-hydroxy-phenyl)propionate hydroxylase
MDHDVAVIGYGPTGATLANLLVLCGLRVLVIERATAIYPLPRAVHFDDEVMRVLQAAGVAGALAPKLRVNVGMRFVDAATEDLLMDWPRPQEITAQGWHASYRFHQPDLEEELRAALEARDGVTIMTGCEVTAVEDRGDHVSIRWQERGTGEEGEARAAYVVGCDGAHSLVRDQIGGGMEDLGFRERWLVMDLLLKRDRPDLGDHSLQFCDPDRPMTYVRCPEARRRWEIRLADDEDAEEMRRPERVWPLLARWITPEDAELERSAVYTFRSAVAWRWRAGRLLVAGDAAHLTPPFMGQGMCAGIRDAANLAWKLALVVRGRAADSLLDSYGTERRPHARAYVETAMRLGGLINALDRDSALGMAEERSEGSARMASIAPALGETPTLFGEQPGGLRGRLFGQPRLADGRLLDDAVGLSPVLLSRWPLDAVVPCFDACAHPDVGTQLDEAGADAVLLRPDRYVLGSATGRHGAERLACIAMPSPLSASAEPGFRSASEAPA